MPVPSLKNIADKSKKTLKDVERYWEKAKKIALNKGLEVTSKGYWPYVMAITKQMSGLTEEITPTDRMYLNLYEKTEQTKKQRAETK